MASTPNDDFDFVPVMAPSGQSTSRNHSASSSSSNNRSSLFLQRNPSGEKSKGKTSPKQTLAPAAAAEYIIDSRLPDNSRHITPPQPARSRHSFVPVLDEEGDDDDIFEAPPSPTQGDNHYPPSTDEKKRPPSMDKSSSYRSRRTFEPQPPQPMEFDDQDDFFENPLPHFANAIQLNDVSPTDEKRRSIRAVALNLDDDHMDEKKRDRKWDNTLSRGLARNTSVRWQWARPDASGDLKSNNLRALSESSLPRNLLTAVYGGLILSSAVALGLASTHVSRATYAPPDSEVSFVVTAVTADILLTTIISAVSVCISTALFGTSIASLRRRARGINRRTFVGPTATRNLVRSTLLGTLAIVFMVGVWCSVAAIAGVQAYNCASVRQYKTVIGDAMEDDYPVIVSPGHAMSMATCRINDAFLAFAVLGACGWVAALVLFVANKTTKLASLVSLGATTVLAS